MLLTPILLSLAVTLACGRPVEKLHWSGEFDYYTFTQEYPPGECYSYSAKVSTVALLRVSIVLLL